MAYNPPQVEVNQIQKTVSPTLIQPDLVPAVIGPAYHVEALDSTKDSDYAVFDGSQTTYTLHGFEAGMALDSTSVYVDLVMKATGTVTNPVGSRLIIASGLTIDANAGTVTVPANADWNGASVFIGYRALRSDLMSVELYESLQAVVDEMTDVSALNPLGFALVETLNNGNAATYAYGTVVDDFASITCNVSGIATASASHTLAMTDLEAKEVYALAPLTYDTAIIANYKTHVNAMSLSTAKKERIVFGGPKIPWGASKAATATAYSAMSAGVGAKRVIYVFPDVAFIRELRHISTLRPQYISDLYTSGYSVTVNAYIDQLVTFSATNSQTAYRNYTVRPVAGLGVEITEALWLALRAHAMETGDVFFYAYVPVPISVIGVPAVAGMIAGNTPQQPMTNLSLANINSLKYSSDYFTEAQLNTIAQGGTYILKQSKLTSPIVCRHQLSTDMSSIEKREVSITKTVDYTAKFVRSAVEPFIGRYVINRATLDMITIAIKGAGSLLIRDGILNDFVVASVAQDTVSRDTVLVSITILPPYPVNYIKIDLIF
jgi:hypothetical protein